MVGKLNLPSVEKTVDNFMVSVKWVRMIEREEGRKERKRAKENHLLYICIYWDPI